MKYKLTALHIFHGTWIIEADSEEEAIRDLNAHCTVIRGSVSTSLFEEEVQWNIGLFSDTQITDIKRYELSKDTNSL